MIMITVRGHSAHNIDHPDGCTLRKGFYDGCHVDGCHDDGCHDYRNYDCLGGMTTRLVAIGAVVMIAMIFANIFPQIMDYWNFRTNPARCI